MQNSYRRNDAATFKANRHDELPQNHHFSIKESSFPIEESLKNLHFLSSESTASFRSESSFFNTTTHRANVGIFRALVTVTCQIHQHKTA